MWLEGEGEEEDLAFEGGASPGGLAPQKYKKRCKSLVVHPTENVFIPKSRRFAVSQTSISDKLPRNVRGRK